jgi:hypothetical protein
MRRVSPLPVVIFLLVGATACGDTKETQEVVDRADRFVTAMKTEAAKVFPESVKRLTDSLQKAKDQFAAGENEAARTTANWAAAEAVSIAKSVEPKRHELDSTFKMISHEVTGPVRLVVDRIRQFRQSGGLPAGVTRARFDSLARDVATWEGAWKEASDNYQKGEIGAAASKAMKIKADIIAAMNLLGIKPFR